MAPAFSLPLDGPDCGPDCEAILRHAQQCHAGGRFAEGIAWYRRALTFRPGSAEIYNNIAVGYLMLGRHDEAIAHYEAALSLRPAYARVHVGLATLFSGRNQHRRAAHHYRQALVHEPGLANVRFNLGASLQTSGQAAAAVECYRDAMPGIPDQGRAWSQYLLSLNFIGGIGADDVFREHRRFGERYPLPASPSHAVSRDPERRLRIGYLSVEFREHLGSYFIAPILEQADRDRFEIVCYSALPPEGRDQHTRRFNELADLWREVPASLSDDGVDALIRADGIDILVDLAGHSGLNRLPALTRKPAPVQVTWLGYANTTGLDCFDARLVDEITDPQGAERLASEPLIRLPDGFLCFKPPADAPDVGPLPARADGFVTFGAFNSLAKVTPEMLELWASILRVVPGSRLRFKDRGVECSDTVAALSARFADLEVSPDRLSFIGWTADRNSHLACYGGVDIALDTSPYNGTITSCDTLWMGVPFVTLLGDRHAARVGASLLTRIGLPDLVAGDPDRYREIAVGLAGDPDRLAALRQGMRDRLLTSPLCDAPGFTRRLEGVYRDLWRRWCAGRTSEGRPFHD